MILKLSIDIAPLSLTLHAINGLFVYHQIWQLMAIAQESNQGKNSEFFLCQMTYIYGSKFQILIT